MSSPDTRKLLAEIPTVAAVSKRLGVVCGEADLLRRLLRLAKRRAQVAERLTRVINREETADAS